MKPIREKRNSIIHVQNVFFTTPVNIFLSRETEKYIVGYEPKIYRTHFLMYKLSKQLIRKIENPIKINNPVDVNVREDFRNSLKSTDPNTYGLMKTVVVRIVPTRYYNIPPVYVRIFNFNWRRTGMGGLDLLQLKIQECPTIVNGDIITGICYKRVASQTSGGGTHGIHTFLIVSLNRGEFEIGEWIKVSNVNRGGHQHSMTRPVILSL